MSPPFALRYDADALSRFLLAEIRHAGTFAARFPPERRREDADRRNAEKGKRADLKREATVSSEVFSKALAGTPVSPADAHRLWRALGIDPAIRVNREETGR